MLWPAAVIWTSRVPVGAGGAVTVGIGTGFVLVTSRPKLMPLFIVTV